jgi:uncharacterized protein (DUF488 family)
MLKQPPLQEAHWPEGAIFTVGHSTLPIETFIALLKTYGIERLVDIRTVPRSRHNPQFDQGALRASLEDAGIRYVHLKALGGLRRSVGASSMNGAWRNPSFRGYADYMQTEEFADGMRELRDLSRDGPVAILCAEGNPHRCHRSLVCDALFARGVVARHITGRGLSKPHDPTSFARIDGRRVTYPA